jgi:rRNA-processing protein FCF1
MLKEVDFTLENNLETITLKKPNIVYYELYQKAREKAKEAKKSAVIAYLEMKNIKKTYMLDDIDESDSEFEDFADKDSGSENSDSESLEDIF